MPTTNPLVVQPIEVIRKPTSYWDTNPVIPKNKGAYDTDKHTLRIGKTGTERYNELEDVAFIGNEKFENKEFVIKAELNALKSTLETSIDTKVDKIDGKGLSTNDFTNTDKEKLSGLSNPSNATTTATGVVKLASADDLTNSPNSANVIPVSVFTQVVKELKDTINELNDKIEALSESGGDVATTDDLIDNWDYHLGSNIFKDGQSNKLVPIWLLATIIYGANSEESTTSETNL